jgi:outer membrane protein assembly factor BamB
MLFFGTFAGILYALDLNTGEEKWRIKTGGSVCFPPTFNNEKGYALSHDKNIYLFNFHNGTVMDTIKGDYWMCGIPLVSNNHLYYPDWGGNLHSLDLVSVEQDWTFHTGSYSQFYVIDRIKRRILWQYKSEGKNNSHPIIVGDVVYYGSGNGTLFAFEIQTGEKLWEFKLETAVNTPFFYHNAIYFTSGHYIYKME